MQPMAGSHASSVHTLPSAHVTGPPAWHTPSRHVSPVVQALPSLQGAVLLVWTHPVAGLHPSSVHGFASSQLGSIPARHTPWRHVSWSVHALPSSQGLMFGGKMQPMDGSHASSVHTLPSVHVTGPPAWHTPSRHVSPVVQALPSLQGAVLLVWTHPVAGLHPSSVQGFASSQLGSIPGRHTPWRHVSWSVHSLPSSQGLMFGGKMQPMDGSHPSSVHTLPSVHVTGPPAWHAPSRHVSPVVQALPSLQGFVFGLDTHWCVSGSQVSSVQGLRSSQPEESVHDPAPSRLMVGDGESIPACARVKLPSALKTTTASHAWIRG